VSIAEIVGRMEALQSQFTPKTATAATTATNATTFAKSLTAATAATGVAGSQGVTGAQVVASAKKYLGVPYVFGSTNPKVGLDCSSLVQRAYKDLGIKLPRIAADQAREGTKVDSLKDAKPGDLLGFGDPAHHIAIYVGNNKMIAAPEPGDHVKIQDVYEKPASIRRILPDAPVASLNSLPAMRPASLKPDQVAANVPYANLFNAAGAKHGVSPKLLAALAKVESNYHANAVSPAGARGLMQIMPATASEMGVNPMNPASAIDGAARIMHGNLKRFKSLPLAIAAYNAGGGAVSQYGGIPPFAETQAYVPKVERALAALG